MGWRGDGAVKKDVPGGTPGTAGEDARAPGRMEYQRRSAETPLRIISGRARPQELTRIGAGWTDKMTCGDAGREGAARGTRGRVRSPGG